MPSNFLFVERDKSVSDLHHSFALSIFGSARDSIHPLRRRCPCLHDANVCPDKDPICFRLISAHGTVMRSVAMLLARLGSNISAMVAAFSVITVPGGAVTFTITLTVHVLFGAMALFSWQTIYPIP